MIVTTPEAFADADRCQTCDGIVCPSTPEAHCLVGVEPCRPCPDCANGVPAVFVVEPDRRLYESPCGPSYELTPPADLVEAAKGCQQGLVTADGIDHSWCGRTASEPNPCLDGHPWVEVVAVPPLRGYQDAHPWPGYITLGRLAVEWCVPIVKKPSDSLDSFLAPVGRGLGLLGLPGQPPTKRPERVTLPGDPDTLIGKWAVGGRLEAS